MKMMNPDYQEIDVVPFDIEIRNKVGLSVELDEMDTIDQVVSRLLNDTSYSKEEMKKIRDTYLYNVGTSGDVGAKYLINKLIEYSKR